LNLAKLVRIAKKRDGIISVAGRGHFVTANGCLDLGRRVWAAMAIILK
jgi:hypothetical protein